MASTSNEPVCTRWSACLSLRRGGALGVAALAAVLLPKCPLCATALLSVLGVGTTVVSWLAPALVDLRSGAIAAACVLIAHTAYRLARRTWRRPASAPHC